MSYVQKSDFPRIITTTDLDSLTGSNDQIWQMAEISAIEEVSSFLRNRYDVNKEFRTIKLHDPASEYTQGDRVFTTTATDQLNHFVAAKDVPATTAISDTEFWTAGDDRNQKILTAVLIIILYENYTRLNGSEIPNWLQLRYDGQDAQQNGGIIGYLKMIRKGTVQPALPLLPAVSDQTTQSGNRIAHGSAEDVVNRNSSI